MVVHGSNGHSDGASILAKSKVLKFGIQASMILMIEAPPPVEAGWSYWPKSVCCSQASLPWFSSRWLWGHTPGSHDQVNWVPDSGQRSQCQGFFAASLLHSVGCMAFHFQWLVYSEGSGQLIWKKVARRVKQSSVQGASFCKPGQVLAAASTSYLMRNMIAVKELTWQSVSEWRRYFGCWDI